MKKIELSEDFFPEQGRAPSGPRPNGSGGDSEAVRVILGKTAPKSGPQPRQSPHGTGGTATRSPYFLVATMPFFVARNMLTLAATMFRAGLPTITSRRR